jgi:hypothetical protein
MYLSEQERDRRYRLVRKAMNKEGIDALLVVGNNHASGSALFSTGSFRYLTDFFIFSLYGLLLFFREDEPMMLVPMELQETMAKKYSRIKDIRISFNYAETVAQVLQEKGLHDRKIGMISMESLPASTYLSLKERLPKAIFSEATPLVLPFRFIKGEEERHLMEKAGKLNDGAYQEVLKRLKPGMREYEVAGIIEGYHRGKGADKTFNLVFSGPFPATKDGIPFQGLPWCPGQRAIEKGDCRPSGDDDGLWRIPESVGADYRCRPQEHRVGEISSGRSGNNTVRSQNNEGRNENVRSDSLHGQDRKRVWFWTDDPHGSLCGSRFD